MRVITMVLLGLLCSLYSFSQSNDFSSLKPAELIAESKNAGNTFEEISFFHPTLKKKTLVNKDVTDYSLLELDIEQLQKIAYEAPQNFTLNIPREQKNALELELIQVNPFDGQFIITQSNNKEPFQFSPGLHYRGIVKGDPSSLVAISIFEEEVTGLISTPTEGNLVLGKLKEKSNKTQYLLYNDKDLVASRGAYCDVEDDMTGYSRDEISISVDDSKTVGDCVRIYFEVDHDVYQDKGGTNGAVNYITAIFNEAATLYANENVSLVISEVFVWNTPSPYAGTSSSTLLTQFQNYRTSFNGDLAQLVSYQASGGIAVLGGLCHPVNAAKMSFVSINSTYSSVPTYSFSVMVVAHELGHLFGSNHTHACVWNGNNTAIDGCAGFTEGNCALPPNPSIGGTIMSYCHITSVGVNLSLGFGPQPGNVIRNRVNSATCLQACSTGGGGGGNGGGDDPVTCEENEVFLIITLDDYAQENTWKIKDEAGAVLYSGGPFAKASAGVVVRDTFCMPDGCYSFTMYDSYGDGMCCQFGNGSYVLKKANGEILADGGEFPTEETTDFCVPEAVGGGDNCLAIDWSSYPIQTYGGGQDQGEAQLLTNNTVLRIRNNAWKQIPLAYSVTTNTVLEFDFKSTIEGEIHGIGFDDNASISYGRTFKVYGSQNWGIQDFDTYNGSANWVHFTIPVGQYYQGEFDRLFFVADHDSGLHNGDAFFKNIVIREGNGCGENIDEGQAQPAIPGEIKTDLGINIYPNPARNTLNINWEVSQSSPASVSIYTITGQEVKSVDLDSQVGINSKTLDINTLAEGTYLLNIQADDQVLTKKFMIVR